MPLDQGTIDANFTPNLRVSCAEFRNLTYLANGWDRMRRWGGNWDRRLDWSGLDEFEEVPYAGIEGPSIEAGSWAPALSESAADNEGWEPGAHLFRYRYLDSRNNFPSNPSAPATLTVSAASKKLTFTISTTGAANIIRPSDPKVDRVILEACVVGGTEYFYVGSWAFLDSTGGYVASFTAEISDEALAVSYLTYDEDGHDVPPVKRYVLAHKGRIILYGDLVYDQGTYSSVRNSQTITGSGTYWTQDALGTAADPPIAGKRYFHRTGNPMWYEIESYVSATQLTLKDYWGDDDFTGDTYEISSGNALIYFSKADYPESFPPLSWITLPSGASGGRVSAAIGYDEAVMFFTERSTFRFVWSEEPSEDGTAFPVPGTRGAISPRVIVPYGGRLYVMDRAGMWVYSGGVPEDISRPIEKIFLTQLDFAYAQDWHAVYVPRERAIRWYVTLSGDTTPKFYFQYDPDRNTWTTGDLYHGLTESHLGWVYDGDAPRPLGGDENGYVWRMDETAADGETEHYNHLTLAGGSTGVYAAVAETLSSGSFTYQGVEVYYPKLGESRRITTNATNALVLSSAFSSYTPGDELWLGPIRTKLKTKTFFCPMGKDKKRPRFLRVFYEATTRTRYLQVRVYENGSASAKTWGDMTFRGLMGTVIRPGTVDGYPATDWLVDLSDTVGRAEIPLGANAVWSIAVEFELIEPDASTSIWGIEIDGVMNPSPE